SFWRKAVCFARSFVPIVGQSASIRILGGYGAQPNGAPHTPRVDFAGAKRCVSPRRFRLPCACGLHLARSIDHRAHKKGGDAPGSRSRRNDGAGMIRRFLSSVSGLALPLLFSGCAFLPQEAERAEFRDPPQMDRTLAKAGQGAAAPENNWPQDEWWHQFGSPE